VKTLNHLYQTEPALYELDCDPAGFERIDASDALQSVISFIRKSTSPDDILVVVCNFNPMARSQYRAGVLQGGFWRQILNNDDEFSGNSAGNLGEGKDTQNPVAWTPLFYGNYLPPLAVACFKSEGRKVLAK
jgi:1,4-alpha-glucan branching enzyme